MGIPSRVSPLKGGTKAQNRGLGVHIFDHSPSFLMPFCLAGVKVRGRLIARPGGTGDKRSSDFLLGQVGEPQSRPGPVKAKDNPSMGADIRP